MASVSNLQAAQVPGTSTVNASWTTNPAGASCTAVIQDISGTAQSTSVTTASGSATLTMSATVPGQYLLSVTAN